MDRHKMLFAVYDTEVEERDVAVARELMCRMNAGNLDGPADAEGVAEAAAEPSPRPPRSDLLHVLTCRGGFIADVSAQSVYAVCPADAACAATTPVQPSPTPPRSGPFKCSPSELGAPKARDCLLPVKMSYRVYFQNSSSSARRRPVQNSELVLGCIVQHVEQVRSQSEQRVWQGNGGISTLLHF